MKDKEKAIEEFRDMIVYLCKNDIKPSDVSSFIWRHHRDKSFSEIYKYIKELADAVDQKGLVNNMDTAEAVKTQYNLIGNSVKDTLNLLTSEEATINDLRIKIQKINDISRLLEKGFEFKRDELCELLKDLRYGLEGVMYNYDECARKIENLSSTILTTPESLKILTE